MKHSQITNVYDEMFYAEIDYVKHHKATGFPMMKQIKHWDRKNVVAFDELTMLSEGYKPEYLDEKEELTIGFSYTEKIMGIVFLKEIEKNVYLQICYSYSLDVQLLEEYIGIALTDSEKSSPTTESEIQEYLDTYKITKDYLKEKSQSIMHDKLLVDWFAQNDSRFSLGNIGEVTVEKDKFLE